jgi:hypothetical protein
MNIKSLIVAGTLLLSLGSQTPLEASIKEQLKLQQETFLTDTNGVILVKAVLGLKVGDIIRIYRTDGYSYTGRVTEITETHAPEDPSIRISGIINNVSGAQFGFGAAKGGMFAGAIIEPDKEFIYALELSESHKGYIFLPTTKYSKPNI